MDHYYSKKPVSENKPALFKVRISSHDFSFKTSSSVFSKDKLDKGSFVLITKSDIKPNTKILDLGCGYGPVGIILGKLYDNLDITMSDVNERALLLTRKNLLLNHVKAKVIESSIYEKIEDKYDTILCNPPQSAGKNICIEIIKGAKDHLKKGGSLQIVVRHQKGGKHLSKIMEETFGNIETLARKSGYHVYISKN